MCERPKVAFLGAGGVGKTSLLNRFMFGTFQENYVETVEEIYSYQFDESGKRLDVNFLDTAGNIAFPAMRQLYISKAEAFVLVYSIKNEKSFHEVKILWEQIKMVRPNILDIPCVIVGNNLDEENVRQVETFDALNWACSENLGGCFVETSAKENKGVRETFSLLLEQFLTRRREQKGPFKLRSLSLHKLHIDTGVHGSDLVIKKKGEKSKDANKVVSNGNPCLASDSTYGNNNSVKSKIVNIKNSCVDKDGRLRRSKTDGVIEICKSQGRQKWHLF